MDIRTHVTGDAEHGWIVDIHDGTNHGAYSPEAPDAETADRLANEMHKAKFYPEPEPPANVPPAV